MGIFPTYALLFENSIACLGKDWTIMINSKPLRMLSEVVSNKEKWAEVYFICSEKIQAIYVTPLAHKVPNQQSHYWLEGLLLQAFIECESSFTSADCEKELSLSLGVNSMTFYYARW